MTRTATTEPLTGLHCMEVRGGNRAVDTAFSVPGLDIWAYSRPCGQSQAGGDVHLLSSCASGRITRAILADVAGHGDRAAKTAQVLHDLMHRYINRIDQSHFVADMNEHFTRVNETGVFATALVMSFFSPTNRMMICNAGHPSPLIFRQRERRWRSFFQYDADASEHAGADVEAVASQNNLPIGVEKKTQYQQSDTRLEKGDLVLMFSDAVVEARRADDRWLGAEGALAMLNELDATRPEAIIPAVLSELRSTNPANLTQDDLTLLLLRVNQLGPKLRDNLLAPFRYLRDVLGWYRK